MKRDVDAAEIEREMVRAIQAMYPAEHQALENWGRYSRDRDDRPAWIVSPGIYSEAPTSKWEIEDEGGYAVRIEYSSPPERGDRREPEPYDEKAALDLCERMHSAGGLPDYLRDVVRVAYYERHVREDELHDFCKPACEPSTFRERLEDCLIFVRRFL